MKFEISDISAPGQNSPRYFFNRTPSAKKYSPGVSEVPAKSEPIMTVDAPSASALMIWPTDLIPPSAITGTPNLRAYSATRNTAVAWGRPTAITSWVMQIEPLPIPTRSASAPASIRFFAWAAVTTFPATICNKYIDNFWVHLVHCWPFFSPKEIAVLTIGELFKTSFARSQPPLAEISYDVSQNAVFQVSSYLSPLPLISL